MKTVKAARATNCSKTQAAILSRFACGRQMHFTCHKTNQIFDLREVFEEDRRCVRRESGTRWSSCIKLRLTFELFVT